MGWRRLRVACVLGARTGLPFDALLGHPRVFHSPLGYGPVLNAARTITTVHDLYALTHPEWHPARTVFFMQQTLPVVARRSTRVIVMSDHVRRDVVRELGVSPERVTVIPLPVGHEFRPVPRDEARAHVHRRFGLAGEYVLHVGTLEPRKNHVTLFAAYERMRRDGFTGPLVLVGHEGWRNEPILRRLADSSARAHILRVTDADERDLVALYGASTVVAFPSLEEGFGYPIIESMACGVPCVTGNVTAMAEVGAGYATLVPPTDADALADALLACWRDPSQRERAAVLGPERAAGHSFERWAAATLAVYREELALASRSDARA